MTYLSLFPSDLLPSLFLYFDSAELLFTLPQLRVIKDFNRLFNSRVFWLRLWRRDISSFVELPENPYETYQKVFSNLHEFTNKHATIEYLVSNGYDILLLHLFSSMSDYNWAMASAAGTGHIEIVKLMLEKGANNYNNTMIWAASNGHTEIVKLMLMRDTNYYDYNWAMINAAYGGYLDIVELMLKKGANGYNGAMLNAANNGHKKIVKLMLEKGANNYASAISDAKTKEIADLIRSYQHQ